MRNEAPRPAGSTTHPERNEATALPAKVDRQHHTPDANEATAPPAEAG
ncbi:hypothetical protein ACFO1B_50180 [Dactylosporangium siamense]|nr:hypothetical protein [Dactylosporangium siamense]